MLRAYLWLLFTLAAINAAFAVYAIVAGPWWRAAISGAAALLCYGTARKLARELD